MPASRSTPRASSSSTAALTVVRAMPAAGTRSALLTAAPEATSRATVLSVTLGVDPDGHGGVLSRSGGSGEGSSITARFRRKNNAKYTLFSRCTALVNAPMVAPAGRPTARWDGHVAPLLTMRGIVKQFPGVRALDGVDLDVAAGEVHCLLGQNGAGKSTLIKVLAGAHRPDAGEITLDGRAGVLRARRRPPTRPASPPSTRSWTWCPGCRWPRTWCSATSRPGSASPGPGTPRSGARALLRRLGHPEIPPRRELGRLSAAGQQVVSMARALARDARLIVMDEPSAVLDPEEVQNLFRVIRELTADGVAVVYISHRLEEIRQIGDRVTVLKDGRTVARNLPARDTPTAEVIRLMTGRTIEYVFPERRHGRRRTASRCSRSTG